jgi:hypothetical protein
VYANNNYASYVGHTATHNTIPKIEAIPNTINIMLSLAQPGPLGPPPPTGSYSTLAEIKPILQAYACENGYAISIIKSTPKDSA